ncbi:struthiocalcin-1-like [Monodelphis domestica]|uniref:struthiocalcin-1-like n=1 Tax=Monodelphis domestica TaxID=13616 RepID=UPI000443213E|nr:struthiocalcin-1-like [Monodelphis domestica]
MGLISDLPCLLSGCLLLSTLGEGAVANKTSTRSRCPPDYVYISGWCYVAFGDLLSWSEAYLECARLTEGASLATIRNEQDQQILGHLLASTTARKQAWIGLRRSNGYRWVWVDGSRFRLQPFDLLPWSAGYDCAVLDTSGDSPTWVAESCSNKNSFICQMPT